MFSVKVIADSISGRGDRITTLSLEYPRFIHSEFMTHRVFSRNASSSRAIPVKKMLARIKDDPAMPVWWGKNVSGMQAPEELGGSEKKAALETWLLTRDFVLTMAEKLNEIGLHKQIANRILEPWMHINTVVTSTEWANFFALRDNPMAQPEFGVLASMMKKAMEHSLPKLEDDWHLPYVTDEEKQNLKVDTLIKFSVARCARVSYLNHEGVVDPEADIDLHDKLLKSGHMSPFEHQARPSEGWSGNFWGWHQYRKDIPNERVFRP